MPQLIPVDIWIVIFQYCLLDSEYVEPSPASAPLLLCRVSRSWRRLALSHPGLWNSLAVDIYLGRSYPHEHLALAFLNRSGALPLSLRVKQGDYSSHTQSVTEAILHHAAARSTRLSRLKLTLAGQSYKAFLRPLQDKLPFLESFDLFVSAGLEGEELDQLVNAFRNAPRLRTLKLISFAWYPSLQSLSPSQDGLAWVQQLTHVSLNALPGPEAAVSLISNWPNLLHCDLGLLDGFDRGTSIRYTQLVHSKLRTLKVTVHWHHHLPAFFRRLVLTALQELSVTIQFGEEETMGHTGILNLLHQSDCPLLKLRLCNTNMRSDEISHILHHPTLASLSSFSLTEERIGWGLDRTTRDTMHVLNGLCVENAASILLPSLEDLEIIGFVSEIHSLANIVCSRWHSGRANLGNVKGHDASSSPGGCTKLRRFRCSKPHASDVDLSRLEKLAEEGLELEFDQATF